MRIFLLLILSILTTIISYADDYLREVPGDHSIGAKNAPVTIIEYSSLTCPHCADFHNNVLPKLKEKYISTGKVRFIQRSIFNPEDKISIKATMIPWCAGNDYLKFLKALMKTQKNWLYESNKHLEVLTDIVSFGGMNSQDLQECLNNKEIETKMLEVQLAANKMGIESTPTFIINGKIHRGYIQKNALFKIVDKILYG